VLGIFIEGDYPDTMNDLIAQLDDGGVPKDFVHPIFGTFKASCERWSVVHDVEDAADSATIQISFAEHTDEVQGPVAVTHTTPAKANSVRALAEQVTAALATFQEATEALSTNAYVVQVNDAIEAAQGLADTLEETAADLSALEIQKTSDAALSVVNEAVEAGADYDSTEAYDLGAAVLSMSSAMSELAKGLIEVKPPLIPRRVEADTNLLALAHDVYGDSSRADEMLALNNIPDPSLIPAGFAYVAYAE
jgi:prophage DNA circulation protein